MAKERRKSKRVLLSPTASMVYSGKSYDGTIQNVSEEGVEYLLTSFPGLSDDFVPEKAIDLVLKDASGKKYKLNCEVKWYLRGKGGNNSLTLGMRITDTPSKYKELIALLATDKQK